MRDIFSFYGFEEVSSQEFHSLKEMNSGPNWESLETDLFLVQTPNKNILQLTLWETLTRDPAKLCPDFWPTDTVR